MPTLPLITNKPKLLSTTYLRYFVVQLILITLIFTLFDYLEFKAVHWDWSRFGLSVVAYILFTFIKYRWDIYVYEHPEKFPQPKPPKFSTKTYAEHKTERLKS